MVIKNKFVAMVIYCICCLIFGNILEYLFASFITHSPFTFSITANVVDLLIFALISGYFIVYRNFDKKKD